MLADTVHSGEIWNKSSCAELENRTIDAVISLLLDNGYVCESKNIYKKYHHRVIICLVDDFVYRVDHSAGYPYIYDKNTTVITDNKAFFPARYQILKLPDSFFGIYYYVPQNMDWTPERDFSYSVNRLDKERLLLLLDIVKRTHLHRGYVNFNCELRNAETEQITTTQANFIEVANRLDSTRKEQYNEIIQYLTPLMPYKNYKISHADIHNCCYLNVVVETYFHNNFVSALSEKIFRSLVTPAPWVVYTSAHSVAYLESLGFDTLNDIVDHTTYDGILNDNKKIDTFVWHAFDAIKHIKTLDRTEVKRRCIQAATHNQALLASMRTQWNTEFDRWLGLLSENLVK